MRTVLLLLPAAALLTACASPTGSANDGVAGPASSTAPPSELVVEIQREAEGPVESWTLACGEDGGSEGDHPEGAAACAHLAGVEGPFEPVPDDAVCTEQYGGPQTAHVTGVWRGEPVDLHLSRENGCAISQWDALGPLLPGPVGVTPPN